MYLHCRCNRTDRNLRSTLTLYHLPQPDRAFESEKKRRKQNTNEKHCSYIFQFGSNGRWHQLETHSKFTHTGKYIELKMWFLTNYLRPQKPFSHSISITRTPYSSVSSIISLAIQKQTPQFTWFCKALQQSALIAVFIDSSILGRVHYQ